MPNPRKMRWDDPSREEEKTTTSENIAGIVKRLTSNSPDAAVAAQELYALTSFSAAVTIDHPAAYTAYDRAVFGGTKPPDHVEAQQDAEQTEWVDGKSYKMGDGFMTFTEEGEAGTSQDTRRVPVMHSRNATSNRIEIGQVEGVFEGLVAAIASGTPDTRYHSLRALSQISFRNAANKKQFGETPNAIHSISMCIEQTRQSGDKKCLAEACRALSLVVSGDRANQELMMAHPTIVQSLQAILADKEGGEAEGQAGKVLNTICHLLPV
mmetsp:Transcript_28132/g.54899  ORF Transcript_28132/g.54899 Transcript_28132/m.54899 type:complete len:267 (-) Transcript_28132:214-1014(-)|eukprot:CAMPEP_0173380030 /NCGR_PEP_ID=MMETSP1356-20130122/2807_1 /TAXON_ID=77927 ORGANISM="Hemiselmis virescens, Strain PCC157" /NCGR_SAMPLE_ID=MMETSP1356 /ASSEMBLY_ACC=CAM_ASM_000847 /LENGTH=266 /DNA_ID=CAMNT_0014333503 /DNA_START=95 /DNA_END=895 /DNA_ORIENTATION=+